MSIAYIWFNQYGRLKNIEMNFSQDLKFKYYDNCLYIEDNLEKNELLNFLGYDNIYNVTAIIGENGTGKSTIIQFFLDLQNYQGAFPSGCYYIIVFDNGGKYIAFSNIDISTHIISNKNIVFINGDDTLYNQKLAKEFEKNKVINYTEAFNPCRYEELIEFAKETKFDYSVEGRIARGIKYLSDEYNHDPLRLYHHKMVENQIKVIEQYASFNKNVNRLLIRFVKYDKLFFQLRDNKKYSDLTTKIDELYELLNVIYTYSKNHKIIYALLTNLIKRMLLSLNVISSRTEKCTEIILLLNNIFNKVRGMERDISMKDIDDIIDMFDNNKVLNISGQEKVLYHNVIKFFDHKSDYLEYREDIDVFFYRFNCEDSWSELRRFYDDYSKTALHGECKYIDYSWGMSTGEMSLFNLFAILNNIKETFSGNLILFFDEAGLYWHPRWQQEGMKRILDILNELGCETQLIIATHSPIFLSDVPKSSTLYLNGDSEFTDEKMMETFGANIYNIYMGSFLNKCNDILVIGEVARSVINKILKRLSEIGENNKTNESEERELEIIRRNIEKIGERIIRNELLRKWEIVNSKLVNEINYEKENIIIDTFKKLDLKDREKILNILRSEYNG